MFHVFKRRKNELDSSASPMVSSVEKLDGVLEGLARLRLVLLEQLVRYDGLVTLAFGYRFISEFLFK